MSLTKIGLQIPRWLTKWLPCKAMAVSQAFIFHFKCYSLLPFAVCQLLRWLSFLYFMFKINVCNYCSRSLSFSKSYTFGVYFVSILIFLLWCAAICIRVLSLSPLLRFPTVCRLKSYYRTCFVNLAVSDHTVAPFGKSIGGIKL